MKTNEKHQIKTFLKSMVRDDLVKAQDSLNKIVESKLKSRKDKAAKVAKVF